MLWSTIGLLSAAVLVMSYVQSAHAKSWLRMRWVGGLMCGWGLNFAFGLMVFLLASKDIITDYWVWKPLLMASSFGFMALVATIFHVNRNVAQGEANAKNTATLLVSALGFVGLVIGVAIQLLVVS